MSANILGTLFRIVIIAFGLLTLWFLLVSLIYVVFIGMFNMEFSFKYLLILFGIVLFIRVFYPKNVFKCN